MITAGEGKYRVWLKREDVGSSILYILGGGERSHVGSVVVKEPGKSPSVVTLEGHFDDVVLTPIAEAACEEFSEVVVVVGGVHIDNATRKEIDLLVSNCKQLVKCIVSLRQA